MEAKVQQQQNHRQAAFAEEVRLMELLVEKEVDEDGGELEGPGNNFCG